VPRGSGNTPDALQAGTEVPAAATGAGEQELPPVHARVKWFDATRGFGFLVSDEIEGDILLHFSVLKDHGRRSLPEGASVECVPVRLPRGLQAKRILTIDLATAVAPAPRVGTSSASRSDRVALAEGAGEFEPVEVKWFNRVKGYGFVNRIEADMADGEDVFLHMETVRLADIGDLQPGQRIDARIASSNKGLTAVEVRLPE
jgi:CspA family cold shock protein